MKQASHSDRDHDHSFGQHHRKPGESKTLLVIGITASAMVVEIIAGLMFGSMALLADGLHMASHAAALSINAFAYIYARRHAFDRRFSFGTGKVNALGGFAGAVLLAVFALFVGAESFHRLYAPVPIAFNQAILVACLGLAVNGLSVLILGGHGDHGHHHHGSEAHSAGHEHRHDHNLRSAYLHVLADALTSVLAIAALLSGKFLGWNWLDPAMGIVGAILIARWSLGLLRDTSGILVDVQAPAAIVDSVRAAVEQGGEAELTDVHVWSIGPGIYAAALTVRASDPMAAEVYRERIPAESGIVHCNVEVEKAMSDG